MSFPPRNPDMPLVGPLATARAASPGPTELETEVVALFDRMRGRLLRYILGFGLAVSDAEEIVQDTFLALYRHLVQGKSRDGLPAWLFRVAHNLSLKRRLALSRISGSAAGDEAETPQVLDPAPNPEDQLAFRQRQDRLRSVYHALSQADRQCLYLRAEGLRYREIAEVLGISVGSVANSLARSLARLSAVDGR
jgi:RNA polymerase sigma-70 factor, ECF subfamily